MADTDLIERLKEAAAKATPGPWARLCSPDNILSLIDRLATLQSELDEARGALEPFAKIARLFDHMTDDGGSVLVNVRLGDLRRARAATRTTGGDNGE